MSDITKEFHQFRWSRTAFPIEALFPFLSWVHLLTLRTIKADLNAGFTGAVIVLPQGVAFATIAGLPPEYGLYSAIVPTVIAALFGSSFHLISGPTTAISLVVYANISIHADPFTGEYIAKVLMMTFMAGVIQLSFGMARLGRLVDFVSHSVVVGFTSGAALLIMTSQLGGFIGVTLPKGMNFYEKWRYILENLHSINGFVFSIALTTLLISVALKSRWPKQPGMLYAIIIGGIMAYFVGGKEAGITLVGSLPSSLPTFSLPDFSLESIQTLFSGALAVAVLGLAEAVSIGRSVATHSRQHINSNQEFIGQGLSNILGSFFSCYASSGSFTRTGVNYTSGARTPLSAIFAAILLSFIILLIAPLTAYLPIASVSGVLMVVAFRLIDFHHISFIVSTNKSEAMVLFVTFASTLFLHLEFAIYVGVILSVVLYLKRVSKPNLVTLVPHNTTPATKGRIFGQPSNEYVAECPQLKIIRLEGEIFFGAINHIIEELHRISQNSSEQCHILISGAGINYIDLTGCDMLSHEVRSFRQDGRQIPEGRHACHPG
jgi:SulP family sulfate permease